MEYHIYILKSPDKSLILGFTADIFELLAKYLYTTRSAGKKNTLIYFETKKSFNAAKIRLEYLNSLNEQEKFKIITKKNPELRDISSELYKLLRSRA